MPLLSHSGKSCGILVSLGRSSHDVSSTRDIQETSSNISRDIPSENFDTFSRKIFPVFRVTKSTQSSVFKIIIQKKALHLSKQGRREHSNLDLHLLIAFLKQKYWKHTEDQAFLTGSSNEIRPSEVMKLFLIFEHFIQIYTLEISTAKRKLHFQLNLIF